MSHFNSYAITCPSLIFFIIFGYIIFLGQTSMMSGVWNIRKKFAAIRNNSYRNPTYGSQSFCFNIRAEESYSFIDGTLTDTSHRIRSVTVCFSKANSMDHRRVQWSKPCPNAWEISHGDGVLEVAEWYWMEGSYVQRWSSNTGGSWVIPFANHVTRTRCAN